MNVVRNLHSPVFEAVSYDKSIGSLLAVNSVIVTLRATDNDADHFGIVKVYKVTFANFCTQYKSGIRFIILSTQSIMLIS